MTKIAINTCYGGFSLSDAAVAEYIRRKFNVEPYENVDPTFKSFKYYWNDKEAALKYRQLYKEGSMANDSREITNALYRDHCFTSYSNFERDDPVLISIIEEWGKKANGRSAELKIVEIPDDVDWEIDEYDGVEHVAEKHRTWA